MNTRCCIKCGETKLLDDFYRSKTNRGGRATSCKVCAKAYVAEWQRRNKERNYSTTARWQARNPERMLLVAARQRAKQFGLPFDLVIGDVDIPDTCPVLGIPLVRHHRDGQGHDDSPSLDRFIPELGYVRSNVAVISNRANRIKCNASADEVERLLLWMRRTPELQH